MGREIDMMGLVLGLHGYRKRSSAPNCAAKVLQALTILRRTDLPEAYIDGLQDELLQMACQDPPADLADYVYLAFHGEGDRANYMKVGIARNVGRRMTRVTQSSPLPRLWVWSAPFIGRHVARKVEAGLLDHMRASRTNGEWTSVGQISEGAAEAIVHSLAEVAATHTTQQVYFTRTEV